MTNLTQDELQVLLDNVRVGQVYKSYEDNSVVLVSMILPKEVRGYIYDGFSVNTYYCLAPLDFVRYYTLALDTKKKKGSK